MKITKGGFTKRKSFTKSDSTKDVTATVPVQINYSQLDESQRSDSN